jgi:alkylhydroperoxidase/carboxymuconolactone decarboxylase family protein YurZ
MRWSVSLTAEGDRELTREEIVELADAVAPYLGVASGIGTTTYGAQLVVDAADRDAAVAAAREAFTVAAATAGLPAWPIASAETLSEAEDEMDDLDLSAP